MYFYFSTSRGSTHIASSACGFSSTVASVITIYSLCMTWMCAAYNTELGLFVGVWAWCNVIFVDQEHILKLLSLCLYSWEDLTHHQVYV